MSQKRQRLYNTQQEKLHIVGNCPQALGLNECVQRKNKEKKKKKKEENSKGNIPIGVVFIIAVSSVHSGIYLAWFTYCPGRSCHAEREGEREST